MERSSSAAKRTCIVLAANRGAGLWPAIPTRKSQPMRLTLILCLVIGAVCLGGLFAADDKNPAFTSAAEAGPDFAIQGEYQGKLGEHAWGVQVVALGDGKFDVVGFAGGLPGDGWKRGDETKRGTGELQDGVVKVKGDTWTATIKDNVFSVFHDPQKIGELKKIERKSPTLGAKNPAAAIVLFDGTNTDQFEGGQIVEGNLLGASSCVSKQRFGDHFLHIEFRTPFMPKSRGQARGNSGVYAQGRY